VSAEGRWTAIVLGSALGGLTALAYARWREPEEPRAWSPGARVELEEPPADCELAEVLRVTGAEGRERLLPLGWKDSGREGKVLAAVYRDPRDQAEARTLVLLGLADSSDVRVMPAYEFDVGPGLFQCAVLEAHLHRHADVLGFDLVLELGTPAADSERWRGHVRMP